MKTIATSVTVILCFSLSISAQETSNEHWRSQERCGWTVHLRPSLAREQEKELTIALDLLDQQLQEIIRVVPNSVLKKMQRVPLWISPEYPKIQPRAEYHPGVDWLRKNGRDPLMVKGIEFTNVRIFEQETKRMPNFALHELAHAFHDQFLPDGFQNSEIKRAYAIAKESGIYDRVEQRMGDGRTAQVRAYAMTTPQEYFAESSEALFSINDFFPFTREQLAKHDPTIYALLQELYELPNRSRAEDAKRSLK